MPIQHAIFAAGVAFSRTAAGGFAKWFSAQIAQNIAQTAINASIGFVADTYEQWAGATPEQLEAASNDALARALSIHSPGLAEDNSVKDDALANRILNVLQSRSDGAKVLGDIMAERAEEVVMPAQLAAAIPAGGMIVGCTLGEIQASNNLYSPARFGGENRPQNFIRKCGRRSSDGTRISKQPHEYRYMRDSGRWDEIFFLVTQISQAAYDKRVAGEEPLTEREATLADLHEEAFEDVLNISVQGADYTFGNYVDGVQLRKFGEQMRKVRRVVGQAGSKPILELIGLGKEHFIGQALQALDPTEALKEMIRLNVAPGSGQLGNAVR